MKVQGIFFFILTNEDEEKNLFCVKTIPQCSDTEIEMLKIFRWSNLFYMYLKEILKITVIPFENVIYATKFSYFLHFDNLPSLCDISFPPQFIESCNFICRVKDNHYVFCDENLEMLNVNFSLAQKLNCKSFPCTRISF